MKKIEMKRFKSIFMAGILAIALAGCGSPGASESVEIPGDAETKQEQAEEAGTTGADSGSAGEITIAISTDPGDLSPWVTGNDGRNACLRNVYESLGVNDSLDGGMKLLMLKSYELDEDGWTYHCELYDNIYDTAGNPVKASDVVFSYETAKEVGKLNPIKYVESITETGEYTFDLVMSVQSVGEWENLIGQVYVVSQAAYEASPDGMITDPVGTGCYKMTEYIPASSMTFTKAESYWQNDESARYSMANVDTIRYSIISEGSQVAVALETGTVDVGYCLSAEQTNRFYDMDGFTVNAEPDFMFYCLHYNCDTGTVFDNQKLRQAISYAIDREALLVSVGAKDGTVIKGFGTPLYSDYQDSWKESDYDYYNYDPQKAEELLAESGYNGETVVILIQQDDMIKTFAQMIQSNLLAVGVNAEISEVEAAVYNSTLKLDSSAWDIRIERFGSPLGFCTAAMAGSYDDTRYGEQGTTNFVRDEKFQDVLHTASSIFTNSDETVEALQEYMRDKCYALPLASVDYYNVTNDKVNSLYNTSRKELIAGNGTYNN